MNQQILRSVAASALVLAAASVLAVSCGGDETQGPPPGGDCTFGGQKCQFGCSADSGCVQCFGQSDCGGGEHFCVLGRCEACAGNADCPAGNTCWPRDHQCHPRCA